MPLDGFLDPYFQEVYLDTDSIPLFSRLVKELSADSVDDYVDTLEHEVWKYTVKEPNYGKAARRMYNVFRMTGRYYEAAYIRELFDEPVTALYQVAALIRTLDDAASRATRSTRTRWWPGRRPDHVGDRRARGPDEAEMVGQLLRLRNSLQARETPRAGPTVAGIRVRRSTRSTTTSSGRCGRFPRSRRTSRTSPAALPGKIAHEAGAGSHRPHRADRSGPSR